jgi:hypothetical protein
MGKQQSAGDRKRGVGIYRDHRSIDRKRERERERERERQRERETERDR